jgi:hypothetical protein
VHGSYLPDILPGLVVVSFGLGPVFVGVTAAANAGATDDRAGLVAAILNATQQIGGALGLAIFTALATSYTDHLLASGSDPRAAATGGFHRALLAGAIFAAAAAVISLRTANTHDDHDAAGTATEPRSRKVLVMGRSRRVLDDAVAELRGLGYDAYATNDFEPLAGRFDPANLDLVMFGTQVPADRQAGLRDEIAAVNKNVVYLDGLGGIPGLIVDQIEGAFAVPGGRDLTQALTYDSSPRAIHITLTEPRDLKVTVWWTTSIVPPDPKSDSLILFDDRVGAGEHTVQIPDRIPPARAYATVQVEAAIYTFSISAADEPMVHSALPAR